MAKRAARRLALPNSRSMEMGPGIMSSDTDGLIGDEDANRALVVEATERAIAASLATDSKPLAENAAPEPDQAAAELLTDASAEVLAAPATEAAVLSPHQDDMPTVRLPDAAPIFNSTTFNSTLESAMTTAEDFMAFGQGNMDAFMKSSQIWTAGFQDLGKHMAASAQAQLDQTMSTWKAIAGVKSVKEALDMHTGLARSAIEAAVSETGKLTDASMKLSEQAFAPITARLSLTAEKFGRVAA